MLLIKNCQRTGLAITLEKIGSKSMNGAAELLLAILYMAPNISNKLYNDQIIFILFPLIEEPQVIIILTLLNKFVESADFCCDGIVSRFTRPRSPAIFL